jgi:serine/threonine protein kinase
MNIGPYQVVSQLGKGGMGVVYKATDPRSDQTVAIKMITGASALDRRGRIGLVREAHTTSDLHHPNIVRVVDIGQHKGWLYIVMEFLDGRTLDHIVRHRTPLTVPDKLQIILQLCAGLGHAHAKGVVHRDIKPANVFLLHSGAVKVVDFGLAKLAELNSSTKSQLAGTWLYMSPEQLDGAHVDARSDIWSTGITLYELLTYKLPFSGRSVGSLVNSIRNDRPAPLNSSLTLSQELAPVLERALAKSRNVRYQSIEDLAADVRKILRYEEGSQGVPSTAQDVQDTSSPDAVSDALQAEPVLYSPPDVGFRKTSHGKIAFEQRRFTFRSGIRERIKQSLVGVDLWDFRNRWLFAIAPGLFLLLMGLAAALSNEANVDSFGMELLGGLALLVVSLTAAFVFAVRHAGVTTPRKCRTCDRHMRRASRWSRFFTSNSEIVMGLSDCIAALQQGFFDDAAKLLCVHGSESEALYTVTRYNLEFWECSKCSDQSALIIVEDRIDQIWTRRNDYTESYRYSNNQRSRG